MRPLKILVIDDEKLIRWSFEKKLGAQGHTIFTAESGEEGLELFEQHYPDLVFLDNHLPGIMGIDLMSKLREISSDACIVFMTAYESVDIAVSAMKKGACDYVRKPFTFDEIDIIVDAFSERINIKKELHLLKRHQKDEITFDSIVHQSARMKKVVQEAKKIAQTAATTILLLGESGTGKDVFARAIHNGSDRKSSPFVTINCSSLPEGLLESELFGHEKGAFTDAKSMKKGLFEIAEGGTVFLDEIGEINQTTQLKLLNVLESLSIRRVGGTKDIKVDVRIIAATNADLMLAIQEKRFREDLYYRLQVFQIDLPPLSERIEDVSLLLDFFIGIFNEQFNKKIDKIEPETARMLEQYNWPGNVRELRNVVERAVILQSGNVLKADNLPYEISKKSIQTTASSGYYFSFPDEGLSLDELEKQVIIQALQKAKYNQTHAAQLLGISRDTLRYKKKKHNL